MDAKEMLVTHFDKLSLGLAGLLLAGTIASGFLGKTTAEEQSALVDRYNKDIARKIETAEREIRKQRDTEPPPSFYGEAQRELIGGPSPSAMPGWLFHKRPKIATRIIGADVPEPVHSAPIDFAGSPGLGRIALSWAEGRNEFVDPLGYTVYRRDSEDGAWVEIGEVGPKEKGFVDKDAQPRKQYWYYIESRAEATKRRLAGNVTIELPEDQAVKKSIEIGPFTTRRDVYIEVQQVAAETIDDRIKGIKVEEKAWIKVYRYFADEDKWKVSRAYVVPVRVAKTSPTDPDLHGPIGEVEKQGSKTTDFTTDYVLADTDIRSLEKQVPGGGTVKVEAHVAVIRAVVWEVGADGRPDRAKPPKRVTETFEINNQMKDPGLEAVLQEMKGGGASGGSSGAGDAEDGDE